MEYSSQSLHRLRVLKCEDVSSSDKPKELNCIQGNNVYYNNTIKYVKENEHQTEKAHVKKTKHKLQRKSASGENIKEPLSICSSYVKRLLQLKSPKSSRKFKKRRNRTTPSRQNDEIKVLFSVEARKSKKKPRKINKDLINNKYYFDPNNMCGNVLKEICKKSSINVGKQPSARCLCKKEIPRRESYTLKETNHINVLGLDHTLSETPIQYKVVQFPDCEQMDAGLETIEMRTNYGLDYFQNVQEEPQELYCLYGERGGGDYCNISVQCLAPENSEMRQIGYKSTENNPVITNNCFQRIFDPLIAYERVAYLAKVSFKYLIFGLAMVIWLPCILTTYFCWLVSWPLRPGFTTKNTFRSPKSRRNSEIKINFCNCKCSTDKSIQTYSKDPWSLLLKGVSYACSPIAIPFGIFKSLLGSGNNHFQCYVPSTNKITGKKSHVITSNPKKKYTLSYSRNKGWVMEPATLRSRGIKTKQCNSKKVPKRIHHSNSDMRMDGRIPTCTCPDSSSSLLVPVKVSNPMFNQNHSHKRYCIRPNTRPNSLLQKRSRPLLICKVTPKGKKIKKQEGIVENKSRRTLKKKVWHCFKKINCNMKSLVEDVETELFEEYDCKRIYIHTLRKTPCFCIYRVCPSLYPRFLGMYRFFFNVCHYLLLFFSACIWCPLLVFGYICQEIFCNCF